jgi:hypothetical protein
MIWNINCRRTRRLLALWAGNDLEQRECQAAERHLAVCPGCREVWERLQQSQQVLERVRPALFEDRLFEEREGSAPGWPSRSVWPAVSRHLRSMDEQVVISSWRDWLPAGAVAAACLAIISVTLVEAPLGESDSPAVIMSSPAAYDLDVRQVGRLPRGLRRDFVQHSGDRRAILDDDDPPTF